MYLLHLGYALLRLEKAFYVDYEHESESQNTMLI